jgi:hypothetical protein
MLNAFFPANIALLLFIDRIDLFSVIDVTSIGGGCCRRKSEQENPLNMISVNFQREKN